MKDAGATPESEWRKIKQTYLMLEEWFEDRTLYHMVGFLVSQDIAIKDIQTQSQNCMKSEFEQSLRQVIFERVVAQKPLCHSDEEAVRMDVEDCLATLIYGSKGRLVTAALLLFNVATLLENR